MSVRLPYQSGEIEFIERKSRFIGNIFTVYSELEARKQIAAIRERHKDASHVVYAYDIYTENAARFSDDGEPKGTAGLPVFEIFRREQLTCYCCTVTRYFGGILLGAGGLIRAYANTAKLALEAAGIAELAPYTRLRVFCDYSHYELLRALLRDYEYTLENTDFGERVSMELLVPEAQAEPLKAAIQDRSSGRAELVLLETVSRPSKI